MAYAEQAVMQLVLWLRLGVDIAGAAIIAAGVLTAFVAWIQGLIRSRDDSFGEARLKLARYLALALEMQLGADILSTAVSPTWDQIGKLAAIAVIRTALNYFLRRELNEYGGHAAPGRQAHAAHAAPDGRPADAAPDGRPAHAAPDGRPAHAAPDGRPAHAAPDGRL